MNEALEVARDAVRRHAWAQAVTAFGAIDSAAGAMAAGMRAAAAAIPAGSEGPGDLPVTDLSPEDLEQFGTALWWTGKPDESTAALERAFAGFSTAGRRADAARVALTLGYQAFRAQTASVGGGWLGQAGRLLSEEPEGPMHARMAVFQIVPPLFAERLDDALVAADAAIEIARRTGNQDALYNAMSYRGVTLVMAGRQEEGQRDLDEAAAAAATGTLDLRVASDIYCVTIGACRTVGDLERAGQWADEGERWMERNGSGGYPGICRVHRAELKMLRGDWSGAEQEAREACDVLQQFRLLDGIGFAHYQIGEVRLRMGDLDGASEEFDLAYEYGHESQPGLANLHLARGEVEDARRSLDRALTATSGGDGAANRGARARLLPTQVDIALAAGDLTAARAAVEELEAIATQFVRPLFKAGAMTARGQLLLGEDKPAEASPVLGQSWRLWQSTDLPYEAARARLRYAEALAGEGDMATARRDLRAARATFERLGAALDLRRVDALLEADAATHDGTSGSAAAVDRSTRTFMFTDIVTSTDLVGIIGDDSWADLLRWHDRELRASIAEHKGQEVDHTGDGFFVAFERASAAVECGVDIQRRLARHRREHGFAPWVRIGLHTAEAIKRGGNYAGHGVHVAARVGAAATKEEVLASASVLAAAGAIRFGLGEPREVVLKGVKGPVEVRSIAWR